MQPGGPVPVFSLQSRAEHSKRLELAEDHSANRIHSGKEVPMTSRRVNAKVTLLVLILSGCAALAGSFVFRGYERTWSSLGIYPLSPHFSDARVIPASAEAKALGFDPMVYNPLLPKGVVMDYPRIWQLLFHLGIDQKDTIYFEVTFVSLFFLGVFLFVGEITQAIAVVLACGIFSPSVLLGIERGNNDLVIFFLLALSLMVIRKSTVASAGVIAFAFVLKLFPVFAAAVFFKEGRRRFFKYLTGSILFVGTYCILLRNEIRTVHSGVATSDWASYGIAVNWQEMQRLIHNPLLLKLVCYAVICVLILLSVLLALRPRKSQDAAADELHIDAFRMGAAIYVGTYLIGSNFDYRLMFLLFTIPQLMEWLNNSDSRMRRVARITFTCTLYSLWSIFFSRLLNAVSATWVQLLLDAFAKAVLVGGLTYLFVYSAPQWVQSCGRAFRRSTQPALSSSS
jgi:hypothetical protein